MQREIPLSIAIGVIVVALLLAVGVYFWFGRPKGGTSGIRMNPHGPAIKPSAPLPAQPQTPPK